MLRPAILRATLATPSRRLLPQFTISIVLARRCVATAPPSSTPSDAPPKLAASAEPAPPTATPADPTSPRIPSASQAEPYQAPTADADASSSSSSPSNQNQSQPQPPSSPPPSHEEEAAKKKDKKPRQLPTPTRSTPTLPFHVSRTPSHQLAVYQLAKAGGNKKLTVIKKVEGDRAAFQATLAQALGVGAEAVRVNSLTGHVVVMGHRKTDVVGWLEKQGF